jgi:hypothetical protein
MCSTHSIGMWVVIEKKKGLSELKIPKGRLSLVFAVGRKGKAKKMFVFYIPPYFLQRPHRKWEKEIYTIF